MKRGLVILVLLAIYLAVPAQAWGCAVCYSDPDSAQAKGLNRAILVLLSIIGTVQVGFVAMFVQFRRRTRDQRLVDDDHPKANTQKVSKGA